MIFLLMTIVHNEKIEWVQKLTKYIEKEAKSLNQIIIVQSGNKTYEKFTNVLGIFAQFPNRIINFGSESIEEQIAKLQLSDRSSNVSSCSVCRKRGTGAMCREVAN